MIKIKHIQKKKIIGKSKKVQKVGKSKKVRRGGAILGKGRDGCVIDPPSMCSSSLNSMNKVSKLINVTDMDEEDYELFEQEYMLGKQFTKVDPYHRHFLPGIEMCNIDTNKTKLSAGQKKDIKDCKFDTKPSFLLNIVMKKGQSFKKIIRTLERDDILKSMAYLLYAFNISIYDLKLGLFDIKGDNMLFSSNDDDPTEIFPVLIDFSQDFVRDTGNIDFEEFLMNFGSSTDYIWPIEINAAYYEKYKKTHGLFTMQKMFNEIETKYGLDIQNNKKHQEDFEKLGKYMLSDRSEKFISGIYNKLMVHSLGLSFVNALNDSQKDKFITSILQDMLKPIKKRPYISELLKRLEKELEYSTYSDLYITYEDNKVKKDIEKANTLAKSFFVKESTKIEPDAELYDLRYKTTPHIKGTTPSPKVSKTGCDFVFKKGKKSGQMCGRPLDERSTHLCSKHFGF